MSKNWPNDPRIDFKPPSNLVEMIEKGFKFWGVWKFFWTRWNCGHIKCWQSLFDFMFLYVFIILWIFSIRNSMFKITKFLITSL
jgi:hypothetical protein